MTKWFSKHARLVATIQLLSALMLGGCSIWYGAWYPDAQASLHDQLKLKNPEEKKPDFWKVSFHDIDKSSPVIYTGLALILGLFSGAGIMVSASRLSELEQRESEFNDEQEAHAVTQQYYYESLRDHLEHFFCNQLSNFDDTCRASVYRHDANANRFRMVFRYSKILRFAKEGRVTLPENEGVLGATFLNGDYLYISDLPSNLSSKQYSKDINKKLDVYGTNIQDSTLSRLRMPSRCYFGYAIKDNNSREKFAILIVESTNQNHFDPPESIVNLLNGQQAQIASYVSHIARLDSKLNPYGGV